MIWLVNSKFILKISVLPFAIVLLLGVTPQSFSETELKTVEIFVQPPTGLTMENDMKDDERNQLLKTFQILQVKCLPHLSPEMSMH